MILARVCLEKIRIAHASVARPGKAMTTMSIVIDPIDDPISLVDFQHQDGDISSDDRIRELSQVAQAADLRALDLARAVEESQAKCLVLEERNSTLQHQLLCLKQERAALQRSLAWRVTKGISCLGAGFAPLASRRRRAIERFVTLTEIVEREGFSAIPRRLWTRTGRQLLEQTRISFRQGTPGSPTRDRSSS